MLRSIWRGSVRRSIWIRIDWAAVGSSYLGAQRRNGFQQIPSEPDGFFCHPDSLREQVIPPQRLLPRPLQPILSFRSHEVQNSKGRASFRILSAKLGLSHFRRDRK